VRIASSLSNTSASWRSRGRDGAAAEAEADAGERRDGLPRRWGAEGNLPVVPAGQGQHQAGQAWYVNTGSFILDRFTDGKPSRQANCEYVLFMMLDDIGTKSKEAAAGADVDHGDVARLVPVGLRLRRAAVQGRRSRRRHHRHRGRGLHRPRRDQRRAQLPHPRQRQPEAGRGRVHRAAGRVPPGPRVHCWSEICEALGVVPARPTPPGCRPSRSATRGRTASCKWLSDRGMVLSQRQPRGLVRRRLPEPCRAHGRPDRGPLLAAGSRVLLLSRPLRASGQRRVPEVGGRERRAEGRAGPARRPGSRAHEAMVRQDLPTEDVSRHGRRRHRRGGAQGVGPADQARVVRPLRLRPER
jgi:hypothetical protein